MSDASIRPSELLWMELYASAEEKVAAGNHKARSRMDTLARLKDACDAIQKGVGTPQFKDPKHRRHFAERRVTPENVYLFCTLVGHTGPHWATIRKDENLLRYLRLRNDENSAGTKKTRKPTDHQRDINEALNRITVQDDRSLLWEEIERGRKAKSQLDTFSYVWSRLPFSDIDAMPGKNITIENLVTSFSGIDQKSRDILRDLVARLSDNKFLSTFGLEQVGGRLRLDIPPGTIFIHKVELALLLRLVGAPNDGKGGEAEPA